MENIFFDNWQSIGRTFVITVLAYVAMILLLRVSGKRTLSKMNAFDFVVTIALGSTLAAVSLNKNIALADGILAFFIFIFLQYGITWLSVRTKIMKNLVTSQPSLLLFKGKLLEENLIQERITIEELNMATRKKGISDYKDVDVIVLETTGDITVIPSLSHPAETMNTVKNYPSTN